MAKRYPSVVFVLLVLALVLSACGGPTPTLSPTATQAPTALPEPTQTATASAPALLDVPAEVEGEAIYIPFPVEIIVDGDLTDWAEVPHSTVARGPSLSADPAENGSFTFAVAADNTNLYITMQMPDQNIVAGQHGTEFWNEDSMEFYVNASDDLNAATYIPGIMQVNINAADIGNTDPAALTITGSFSGDANVSGFVFKTEDGWGFEAALDLTDLVEVTHGKEIGFQAQINGATVKDRDVKLIWSKADTGDLSWQSPFLFGRGLFFELGQTDVPQPSAMVQPTPAPEAGPVVIPPQVSVNQVGYFTGGKKIASVVDASTEPLAWELRSSAGEVLLSGETEVFGQDADSGDHLHRIDFSDFATEGEGYTLAVGDLESAPFTISTTIYGDLENDALTYFYLNRSGIEIDAQYAGEDWARPAGHTTDADVTCYKGPDAEGNDWPGCDYSLDVAGGWYDAGDFGKYVVNGGISVWTLQNLYEQYPDGFTDGTQSIPENSNQIPDLLDEARWEMDFLLAMQVPEGEPLAGMAHHKMHDEAWAGLPMVPPGEVDNDSANEIAGTGRYLFPPSTAATLNLAATAAQCARIWSDLDPDYAGQCRTAAERAWDAAVENPAIFYGNNPGTGGGNYDDENVGDEFYWAAAELFITTGEAEYSEYLLDSDYFAAADAFDWGNTAPLGTISLLTVENDLPAAQQQELQQSVLDYADELLAVQAQNGYPPLIDGDYPWGSNGLIMNNMILVSLAHRISGVAQYLDAVRMSMDYILGRNALNKSFVSGYGAYPMEHPHHRFWANNPAGGYPPPPAGALSGGVNSNPADPATDAVDLVSVPEAKRYLDDIDSYTTNEVTINWNAPLVWVVTYLDETQAE